MLEQIKDLCLFMICGQTLLYFQSGKKYEKICRMILELLILAGIVGMILNFLQSLGFRKGEMEAAGSAVAGMQRSMEEALSRQLGTEWMTENFPAVDTFQGLIEKYTAEEIRTRYRNFAEQYGFEIQEVKERDNKLQVFLKELSEEDTVSEKNPETIGEIRQVEIGEIVLHETEEESIEAAGEQKERLETFRRQLALVFAMEEEKLEVILIE